MKSFKNLILMALPLLMVAACHKGPNPTAVDVIKLRAYAPSVTKGMEITTSNLNEFRINAVGEQGNYFEQVATNSGSNGVFNTVTAYPWPTFDIDFYAWAPAAPNNAVVKVDKDAKTFTDFAPADDLADQQDVIVAVNTLANKAENEKTGVDINFRHILSEIVVKAVNKSEVFKVKVKGVKVGGLQSVGTYTFPTVTTVGTILNSERNYDTYVENFGVWSLNPRDGFNKCYTHVADAENVVELTDEAQSVMFGNSGFFVLPQELTECAWNGAEALPSDYDGGAYLSLLVNISSGSGDDKLNIYPFGSDDYAWAAVPISTYLEIGKRYTYILNFFVDGIGAGLTDPQEPGNNNDGETEGNYRAGQLIAGGHIFINTTVDDMYDGTMVVNSNLEGNVVKPGYHGSELPR